MIYSPFSWKPFRFIRFCLVMEAARFPVLEVKSFVTQQKELVLDKDRLFLFAKFLYKFRLRSVR
jgi:hypothetical protein